MSKYCYDTKEYYEENAKMLKTKLELIRFALYTKLDAKKVEIEELKVYGDILEGEEESLNNAMRKLNEFLEKEKKGDEK